MQCSNRARRQPLPLLFSHISATGSPSSIVVLFLHVFILISLVWTLWDKRRLGTKTLFSPCLFYLLFSCSFSHCSSLFQHAAFCCFTLSVFRVSDFLTIPLLLYLLGSRSECIKGATSSTDLSLSSDKPREQQSSHCQSRLTPHLFTTNENGFQHQRNQL